MEKLNLEEIQNEELNILKETILFLKQYNIRYFAFAGTLLGAVRHKGFIPWDDDIDISILREDYEKLLMILKNNNKISDNIEAIGYELGNGKHPFIKIINKKIKVDEKEKVDNYLWIDIFPLDACPSNEKKAKRFMQKAFIMHQLISLKTIRFKELLKSSKTLRRRIIKILCWPITFFIKLEDFERKYINYCKSYNNNKTKYIANVVWNASKNDFFEYSITNHTMEFDFNNIKITSFKEYKIFLEKVYGDFMKLPPEDKRYTHSFDAYKI